MISYPGEILARFGRYEAIQDLGRVERTHIWKAWDPFLERFVTVVALPGINPAELHKELPDLSKALHRWLKGWYRDGRRVLDFGPGSRLAPAYFVFELIGEERRAALPSPEEKQETTEPSRAVPATKKSTGTWTTSLASIAALIVGFIAGSMLDQPSGDDTVTPPHLSAGTLVAESAGRTAPSTLASIVKTNAATSTAAIAPTTTVAIAAAPQAPPTQAPAQPSIPLVLTVRVEPEPGVISLASGVRRDFVAETGDGAPKTYRWDLGGKSMSTDSRYQFASAFLDEASLQTLTLTVTDKESGKTAQKQWTLAVEPRNTPPTAAIRIPSEPVIPGTVVILSANVSDPDLERGDRITCIWKIDMVTAGSSCRRLEWRAPTSLAANSAAVTLTARDARGATVTKAARLTVRAAAPTPMVAAALPAATATVAISAADEERAIRAALGAFTYRYQAALRARKGLEAVARFDVLAVDRNGESATVTVGQVVDIPGEAVQTAKKVYKLRKTNGTWSVIE